jgi:hypothetical protein
LGVIAGGQSLLPPRTTTWAREREDDKGVVMEEEGKSCRPSDGAIGEASQRHQKAVSASTLD